VVKLTPEQIEKVAWAIFLKLHDDNLFEDPDLMAYVEEFAVEGDRIYYKLLRHNGDDAGWHSDEEVEEDPPYAEENKEEQCRKLKRSGWREKRKKKASSGIRRAVWSGADAEPLWNYVNEIDSLSYDG